MIRVLQLILHLPIFMIHAPGNVSMLFSILIPVANFDFDIDWFLEHSVKFANSDEVPKDFPVQFDFIGYGNNAILNMGSVFLLNLVQNALFVIFVTMITFGLRKEFHPEMVTNQTEWKKEWHIKNIIDGSFVRDANIKLANVTQFIG